MDVWLLRHAAAEDRAASGRDQDRVLTPEGLARARAVALGLAAIEPGLGRVITSPYRRASQTAEAAAAALGIEVGESRALEPQRDPMDILNEIGAGGENVLLVGHQPHLGSLLGLLVARDGVEIPMKKAAIARVTLSGRWSGELRALVPPRLLELLGARQAN